MASTQAQLDAVRQTLTNLQSECDASYAAQTNLLALLKLNASVPKSALLGEFASTNKSDPSAGVADPATVAKMPRVVDMASRVAESHDEWWRWAYTFYVGNPQPVPLATTVEVQFLDKDGFLVDHETISSVNVPALTTNSFSGSRMVSMPGASTVTKVNAMLNQ